MKSKINKISQPTNRVLDAFDENIAEAQAEAAEAAEKEKLVGKKTRYTGYISAEKWQKFCKINDCRDMSNTSTMNMLVDEYIAKFKDLLEG